MSKKYCRNLDKLYKYVKKMKKKKNNENKKIVYNKNKFRYSAG